MSNKFEIHNTFKLFYIKMNLVFDVSDYLYLIAKLIHHSVVAYRINCAIELCNFVMKIITNMCTMARNNIYLFDV